MLWLSILILTFMSAYFSSSETAMMKLDQFRLHHLASKKHRGALRASKLLKRQDRLLGVILIGNNLVNNCATLIAGVIAVRLFGELGLGIAAVALTIHFLIFAETAPKTVAAERPELIAFPSTLILRPLLKVLQPAVIAVNWAGRVVVGPFLSNTPDPPQTLDINELHSVVTSKSDVPESQRRMLKSLIELEQATVEDVMVPRPNVTGLELNYSVDKIRDQILTSVHTRLPAYMDSLDNTRGVLHLKRALKVLNKPDFKVSDIVKELEPIKFVPESTPLRLQLQDFTRNKTRVAMVVDEYGEITGFLTLEDILEEVVGEFTTEIQITPQEIISNGEGQHDVSSSIAIRDLNERLDIDLPTTRHKLLNGLLLDELSTMPEGNCCVQIENVQLETLVVTEDSIRNVRIKVLPKPDLDLGDALLEN